MCKCVLWDLLCYEQSLWCLLIKEDFSLFIESESSCIKYFLKEGRKKAFVSMLQCNYTMTF